MPVESKINPNFPVPGIDQSSKGFRDNFATIKEEIENLQSKNIQVVGSLISDPVQIGSTASDVIIPVVVNLANVQAAGSNLSVQYNLNNVISGSQIYYNNGRVGINTATPANALDVIGNVRIASSNNSTFLQIGSNVSVNASVGFTNVNIDSQSALIINNANLSLGLGVSPRVKFDVASLDTNPIIVNALSNNSDSGLRLTTAQSNSTMGLLLEQRAINKLGGLRIDKNGNISIHVNESMDANLSDASRVINILPNNRVGIGKMNPQRELDITGNVAISGNLNIGSVPTITGSRGGNGALSNLLVALSNMGIIINGTTA